ncbi:MAG: GntR family transcriptional regulator [Anaerolineaceae bacterium]|nr:GntR family transcriptional regulator [Anaerolineaceae bacterium]
MVDIREAIFYEHRIDTAKPVPYHTQVYQALEQIITTALQPGQQLPGEPKLCDLFGVSRTVIRHALDQLLRDGLIVRVMGKGTFVAEPKINEGLIGRLTGFYEDMVAQGYTPVSKVLQQELVQANAKVARNLNLPVGTDVIAIRRLRFVNGVPLQLVTTYMPYELCAALLRADFTQQSLYAYLRQTCDLQIVSGTRRIEAVLATDEEARLLAISPGSPLILIDSVSYLEDGTALEYYHAVHRSDRARFEVSLMRVRE